MDPVTAAAAAAAATFVAAVAAPAPTPAPPATAPAPADAAAAPGVLLVSDAKSIIMTTYPKLYSRFNYAFYGHEDVAPLAEVIDVIKGDVHAWLQAMPENFKTSSHALSRPKYGLIYVLKHDRVREALGEAYCTSAIDAIEAVWEECKKDLVQVKDDVPILESEDELRARLEELTTKNEVLSTMLLALLSKHYDNIVATLVDTLLKRG